MIESALIDFYSTKMYITFQKGRKYNVSVKYLTQMIHIYSLPIYRIRNFSLWIRNKL